MRSRLVSREKEGLQWTYEDGKDHARKEIQFFVLGERRIEEVLELANKDADERTRLARTELADWDASRTSAKRKECQRTRLTDERLQQDKQSSEILDVDVVHDLEAIAQIENVLLDRLACELASRTGGEDVPGWVHVLGRSDMQSEECLRKRSSGLTSDAEGRGDKPSED